MKEITSINYIKEPIPEPDNLIDKSKEVIDNLDNYPRYTFSELFTKKKFNDRLEYHRNQTIFEPLFNNWKHKDYEEIEKPEKEQKAVNEVKGVYILYQDEAPVYVGISRKISTRLKNHFCGTSHFQATLVYLMLRKEHEDKHGIYMENRADLPIFLEKREAFQQEMRQTWKVSIIPIEDNYEMYMTEVLLACKLKTKWNSFETH